MALVCRISAGFFYMLEYWVDIMFPTACGRTLPQEVVFEQANLLILKRKEKKNMDIVK